ncbi:MAG: hypothetical protein ACRD7E_01905 [Bryobacteraceae bacterium]
MERPATEPREVSPPPGFTGKPGRPISKSMQAALEMVARNPDVKPAELATSLGITNDYARTLLRRARSRSTSNSHGSAEGSRSASLKIQGVQAVADTRNPGLENTVQELKSTVDQLRSRLASTEQHVGELSTIPVQVRSGMNLNKRTQILRLHENGNAPDQISSALSVNRGEVDFVLKVHHILVSRF